MTKVIVYVANDNGIDGMDRTTCMYASFSEEERDVMIARDPAKAWRSKGEKIIDLELARKAALHKLDGIDRLALGLPSWLDDRKG